MFAMAMPKNWRNSIAHPDDNFTANAKDKILPEARASIPRKWNGIQNQLGTCSRD